MSENYKIDISIFDRINKIGELDWDRCAHNENTKIHKDTFTTNRFL